MSPQIHAYTKFRQEIRHDSPLWTRNVIFQRRRVLVIRIQQLVAVATLGLLLWLWFGDSRYHAPPPSSLYDDAEKPVPPLSEPAPLQANYGREGDYK